MRTLSDLSIVIPTFNMTESLLVLLQSIHENPNHQEVCEVLIIDDGSTIPVANSLTPDLFNNLKIRIHRSEGNLGRFLIRKKGAETALGSLILFLDCRVQLPQHFLETLKVHILESQFLQPQPQIDWSRGQFGIYWDLVHRMIFSHHYKHMQKGQVDLTPSNYDQFLKGTTALVCKRSLFLEACSEFGNQTLLSDDTALLKIMVKTEPLRLCPPLWFWWYPRETWHEFLWRLYDRGPGMVEYHVWTERGWIFKSIVTGFLGLLFLIFLIMTGSPFVWPLIALVFLVCALSVIGLPGSWSMRIQLLPLHVATIFAVGLGILKGLLVNMNRWMKGELEWTPSQKIRHTKY